MPIAGIVPKLTDAWQIEIETEMTAKRGAYFLPTNTAKPIIKRRMLAYHIVMVLLQRALTLLQEVQLSRAAGHDKLREFRSSRPV